MVDRTTPPPFREIPALHMPEPECMVLGGGIPLYCIPGPTQGLLKLEVVFLAGRVHERHPLTARAACRLLREGAGDMDGAALAEATDQYGGSVSSSDSMDHNGLVLQCLSRFFHQLLPLFARMLLEPSFPEKELQSFCRNNRQRLLEDLSKNEVVAYRELTALIFGASHPYGYNSTPEMYDTLGREAVRAFWEDHFRAGNALMVLSGEYDDAVIRAIDEQLCRPMRAGRSEASFPTPPEAVRRVMHTRERSSLQNAVRVGRLLFDRTHPDYYPLYAVNQLLGGYFGSRLMTQIREELGLTYNIYSHIDAMRHSGFLYVSAEVSKEETSRTVDEIYAEMERLRTEEPDAEELRMMQRFVAGNLLHLLDGPFNQADTLRNLIVEGGDHRDFDLLAGAVRDITPARVLELSRRWLDPADMTEVIIG